MGQVLTINSVEEFPGEITETVIGREQVTIEGAAADAETRFYVATESSEATQVAGYQKYVMKHTNKFAIEGKLWNREFKHILRITRLSVYKKPALDAKYAFTIGGRGSYANAAMKRLRENTAVKCVPLEINLIDAVEKIVRSNSGIQVNSGWFSNLGLPNLNNVLLQGDDANQGSDWARFKATSGAALSNVELILEDPVFNNGQVKVAISKRGYVFSHTKIPDNKMVELTERILAIIAP